MTLLKNYAAEIRSALDKVSVAEARQATQQAEFQKFMHQKNEKTLERDRFMASALADHSKRLLDGLDACPDKPKQRTRIRNLSDDIAAIDVILPTVSSRVSEATDSVRIEKANLGSAIAPQLATLKLQELAEFRDRFHDIIKSAAKLVALDRVQERLLGPKFTVNGSIPADLFSSERLIDAFLKDLPERLKLNEEQLRAFKTEVAQEASEAMATINNPTDTPNT